MAASYKRGPHKSVVGLRETLKNLENAGVNIESCVRTACWKHGARISMQAKNNARKVFTGTQLSTTWKKGKKKGQHKVRKPTGRLMGSITERANFSPKMTGLQKPAKSDDAVNRPGGNGKLDPLVVVGTNVEYAPYVELGTKKMHARQFLFPAFFALENECEKTIVGVVREKQACENFKKRLPIFEPEGSWE